MTLAALMPLLPDAFLLALALAVLKLDLFNEDGESGFHVTWIGLAGLALWLALGPMPASAVVFSGYRATAEARVWKLLFTLATLATVFLGWMSLILGWPFVVFWGMVVESHIAGQLASLS